MWTPGPNPNPIRAPHTEPHRPNPRHSASPLTCQSVLLDTARAIKSEPATYAEACGAKSTVPPKRCSVKANLLHYSLQHISTQLRYSANAAQCRAVHTKEHR